MLILVLLLVVVGPERLPGMAYQIGRAVRTMQQYARAVRDEFSGEIAYIEEQYKTVKGEVSQARDDLRVQQTKLESEMRDAAASLQIPEAATSNGSSGAAPSTLAMENAAALSEYGMPDDPKDATAAPSATTTDGEGNKPAPLVF